MKKRTQKILLSGFISFAFIGSAQASDAGDASAFAFLKSALAKGGTIGAAQAKIDAAKTAATANSTGGALSITWEESARPVSPLKGSPTAASNEEAVAAPQPAKRAMLAATSAGVVIKK